MLNGTRDLTKVAFGLRLQEGQTAPLIDKISFNYGDLHVARDVNVSTDRALPR